MHAILEEISTFWKTYMIILVPLVLLPLPLVVGGSEADCAYAVLIMAVFWVTEALPIEVTALLPIVLFPMLGLLPASVVSPNYMRDTNLVFMGGLMMALSVEKSHLHNRVALKVLTVMGTKPRWLMLGFMLPTWFLSMWISNTATTAMMVPVAAAVLQQFKISMLIQERAALKRSGDNNNHNNINGYVNQGLESDQKETTDQVELEITHFGRETPTVSEVVSKGSMKNGLSYPAAYEVVKEGDTDLVAPSPDDDFATTKATAKYSLICKMLSLCVCYSANIGGTATLTGTTPNLVMAGFIENLWAEQGLPPPITWASWIPFGLPLATIALVICWLWLVFYFLGVRDFCCCCGDQQHDPENEARVKTVVEQAYKDLGPMKYDEIMSAVLFIILVFLWFARDPGFVPGYAVFFEPGYVSDSVPAILMATLLFIFPERPPKSRLFCGVKGSGKAESQPALLTWDLVSRKMPWGPIFIVGGGFAMADAVEASGLSVVIADALSGLGDLPEWVMIFLIILLVAVLTNVTSNTATTTLVLPILGALADGLGYNPLFLCLPATVSSSMAFLLPVATPPNAIVFAAGHLRIKDMLLAGLGLNILTIFVIMLGTFTWGMALFDLDTIPWDTKNITVTAMP